jgi:hypothetical protein
MIGDDAGGERKLKDGPRAGAAALLLRVFRHAAQPANTDSCQLSHHVISRAGL